MLDVVDVRGSRRWERVLLVLATLLGVVAMHATIAPMHDQAGRMATVSGSGAIAHDVVDLSPIGGHEGPAATASPGMPGDGPMSMPHSLMHLCLAIMTMGILLGLLIIVRVMPFRRTRSHAPPAAPVSSHPSRPPARHAVRLAQLCVLRN